MSSSNVQIEKAAQLLDRHDVVAMPTETVYGLAARIDFEDAIKKIFSVKERPFFDPLIVHVSSKEQAQHCTSEWSEICDFLSEKFWPGPLTLVLPKSDRISDLITSGLPTVGIRWPRHPIAQQLIQKVGVPLAAPSANKFGRTSPTEAHHVQREFNNQVFVIEGGASEVGIESTVLSVKKMNQQYSLSILRKGAVLKSEISEQLQKKSFSYQWVDTIDKSESPGHMKHHYMPSIPFVICRNPNLKIADLIANLNKRLSELPDEVEGVKIIKPVSDIKKIEFLKLSDQAPQAARELYSKLREASQRKPDALCFMQLPSQNDEKWESIFDRLYKAASLILD